MSHHCVCGGGRVMCNGTIGTGATVRAKPDHSLPITGWALNFALPMPSTMTHPPS